MLIIWSIELSELCKPGIEYEGEWWQHKLLLESNTLIIGCWQGSHTVLKVLNCEIGFQDLEKVLNLTKMYIKYWRKYGNSKNSAVCFFTFFSLLLMRVLQMLFALCSMNEIFRKWSWMMVLKSFNLVLKRYLKKCIKLFLKMCGNPVFVIKLHKYRDKRLGSRTTANQQLSNVLVCQLAQLLTGTT